MFFLWKKRGKRILALALTVVLLVLIWPMQRVEAEELSLYATAAVLMDADTGRVLYGKKEEDFMSNASTTKIMTCILALENASGDEEVEISAYAAGMPKVKLYMKAGEHFYLRDLLYSLMLESHNDSAVAIAEHVGGSVEGFADMMNEKAAGIGCENTCFLTPNGLDATRNVRLKDGSNRTLCHGTTARDLARIMAYCTFESPKAAEFLEITRTGSYSFCNKEGRSFSCNNHNNFLYMMDGALSGKTGFTNKAGYCYVGALEKDGKRFTIALLACGWPNNKTYKWSDARTLFSYGLEHYHYHELNEVSFDAALLKPVPVQNGQGRFFGDRVYVTPKIRGDKTGIGLLLSDEEQITVQHEIKKQLTAPVQEGEVIGKIQYTAVGQELYTEEIVLAESVDEIDYEWCFMRILHKFLF